MYLENPVNSLIVDHSNNINDYIKKEYNLLPDYKTYNTQINDMVNFKCFNIVTKIKSSNNFFINEIKYCDKLEFTYNKLTNEVCIIALPNYQYNENLKIPIFTCDIANIICDKLKKYTPINDIKLIFLNPILVFATDNKTKDMIPSLENTNNYKLFLNIIKGIESEKQKIISETIEYKKQLEKEESATKRALDKKRIIYGINPNDFSTIEEFYKELAIPIKQIYTKRCENIFRHMQKTKEHYKTLLDNCLNNSLYYKEDNVYYKYKNFYEKFPEFYNFNSEKEKDDFLEKQFLEDSCIQSEILNLYNKALRSTRIVLKDIYDESGCYKLAIERLDFSETMFEIIREQKLFKSHPIFSCLTSVEDYIYPDKVLRNHLLCIDKAIGYLKQYCALNEKLKLYEEIKNNPIKAIKENEMVYMKFFSHRMNIPYWQLIQNDRKKGIFPRERFKLLVVNPGIENVDLNMIKTYISKKDMKFISIDELNQYYSNRFIIVIPSSIEYGTLLKVVEYAHAHNSHLNFICENADIATKLKSILINKELEKRKINEVYLDNIVFINIDPNFYKMYYKNPMDLKKLWHIYDYTSNYKYSRKVPYDLTQEIDNAILKNYYENNEEFINYKEVDEQLLGSYSSNNNYSVNNDIYLKKLFKLHEENNMYALSKLRRWNISSNKISPIFGACGNYDNFKLSHYIEMEIADYEKSLFKDDLYGIYKIPSSQKYDIIVHVGDKLMRWSNYPYYPIKTTLIHENIPQKKAYLWFNECDKFEMIYRDKEAEEVIFYDGEKFSKKLEFL